MIEDVFDIECDECGEIFTSNEAAYGKDEQNNICPSCYF